MYENFNLANCPVEKCRFYQKFASYKVIMLITLIMVSLLLCLLLTFYRLPHNYEGATLLKFCFDYFSDQEIIGTALLSIPDSLQNNN